MWSAKSIHGNLARELEGSEDFLELNRLEEWARGGCDVTASVVALPVPRNGLAMPPQGRVGGTLFTVVAAGVAVASRAARGIGHGRSHSPPAVVAGTSASTLGDRRRAELLRELCGEGEDAEECLLKFAEDAVLMAFKGAAPDGEGEAALEAAIGRAKLEWAENDVQEEDEVVDDVAMIERSLAKAEAAVAELMAAEAEVKRVIEEEGEDDVVDRAMRRLEAAVGMEMRDEEEGEELVATTERSIADAKADVERAIVDGEDDSVVEQAVRSLEAAFGRLHFIGEKPKNPSVMQSCSHSDVTAP